MQAIILTGATLKGHASETVWIAVAQQYKLTLESFRSRVLDRAPIILRETEDASSAERTRERLAALGAQVYIGPSQEEKWQINLIGRVRGPVTAEFILAFWDEYIPYKSIAFRKLGNVAWMSAVDAKRMINAETGIGVSSPKDVAEIASADVAIASQSATAGSIPASKIQLQLMWAFVFIVVVGTFTVLIKTTEPKNQGDIKAYEATNTAPAVPSQSIQAVKESPRRADFPTPAELKVRWNAKVTNVVLQIKSIEYVGEDFAAISTNNDWRILYTKQTRQYELGEERGKDSSEFLQLAMALIVFTNPRVDADQALNILRSIHSDEVAPNNLLILDNVKYWWAPFLGRASFYVKPMTPGSSETRFQ